MKKLFLTLGLIGCTVLAHAQGTFSWGNTALTRINMVGPTGIRIYPIPEDGFTFSLYYGPAGSTEEQLIAATPPAVIGAVPGVLTGAETVLALPSPGPGQIISLQVRASHPSGVPIINPPVRQVVLGQTADPGTVIWTTDPSTRTFYLAPEPGTIAVAGAAGLLFGIVRWRRR